MEMAGASAIEAGLDRAEFVGAIGRGEELAEAGEVGIRLRVARGIGGEEIVAVVVRLPELDERVADRLALAVEHAAADESDDALGWGEMIVDDDEIVVFIEGDVFGHRVEWPLGLARSEGQRLGEQTAHGIEPAPGGELAQEMAAGSEGFGSDDVHKRAIQAGRAPGNLGPVWWMCMRYLG